jgi:cytoskeletal protein CcmA (bactofilin family)
VTVDRDVVVQGPIVSRDQIDWQGKRAQSLIAPRIRLGRPAFPLDIPGSILCQTLVLGQDASLSGTLGGSLVAKTRVTRQGSGQAVRMLRVLADATAGEVDVPCAVTLDDRVRLGSLCAKGDVVLGEACHVESVSGHNVVLGAGSVVSHVHAGGALVLGPGCVVQTAIAGTQITVDPTARVKGDLIASASGALEVQGAAWFVQPQYQYRANVAALLDPDLQEGALQGWAAVRSLPHSLYRQLESVCEGWFDALRPLAADARGEGGSHSSAGSALPEEAQ